ncbi:MAG: tetratricopeptide repeat protein [Myxococcales bacterium]|nr:tetratricopeptide repeat protein [Myxococcales bacterium]
MDKGTKRLAYLLKLTREAPPGQATTDPFVWYGLAMEYRGLERFGDALATFEDLRALAPGYVPIYLMCGQMLESMGRKDDARAWLQAGLETAKKGGDVHAAGELASALEALEQ